ncbi:MAG TPA: hypothetical protein VMG09_01295 [Bacteroidota bacterium]|nr:hypothetical protein [Bacteroidota bacterium]
MPEEGAKPQILPAPPPKKWIDNIAAVSSALIAIGTLLNWFFGRESSFPKWFFYVLTILILVILYKYFEESIKRFFAALAVKNYIREAHFKLLDNLQRFSELVSPRSDDSIVHVIETVSTRRGKPLVDRDLYPYADQLVQNILLKLSESGRGLSAGEFKGVLNDLTTLIRFCTYFYFKKPFHVQDAGDLTKDEMKELEFARENFADFLRRYQIFFDEVSVRLGLTSRAHFEIPKPLSSRG